MLKLSGKDRYLCFDMEAIGFVEHMRERQHDAIHIIRVKDEMTGERWHFFDEYEERINRVHLGDLEDKRAGSIADGLRFLKSAKAVISQNGSGYDFLVFRKIYPDIWKGINYGQATGNPDFPYWNMDTMVMSQVLNPERKVPFQAYDICKQLGIKVPGPHSIAAHGMRIGRFKPDHEDWSKLTKDMVHRVDEDVEIGSNFFHWLMNDDDDGWHMQALRGNKATGMDISHAYFCEMRLCQAVANQAKRGFRLDMQAGLDLCAEIDEEMIATEEAFRPHMPMRKAKARISEAKQDDYLATLHKYLKPAEVNDLNKALNRCNWRIAKKTTKWDILTKAGKYTSHVTKQYPEARGFITDHRDPMVVGPFTPIDWEEIPLGNRDLVKQVLFDNGWLGINFNDTELDHIEEYGEVPKPWSGKIDEKSMTMWEERAEKGECRPVPGWAAGIARWYILSSRRNQVLNKKDQDYYDEKGVWPRQTNGKHECRGLLPKTINHATGTTAMQYYEEYGKWPVSKHEEWRIPAGAFACATNTFRMKHRNVVNIPSRGLYPLRHLFIAGIGKVIIGCDGAGLELRMLAHFMNDPEYMDVILNGDIHTYNQQMAGLPIRDMAKTFD